MAKKPQSESETPPNTPAIPAPIDLGKYRQESLPTEEGTDAETEKVKRRPQLPRIHWQDLAGIRPLQIADVWAGVNDDYGPYMGAVIRLPDGVAVSSVTGEGTAAGQALHRAMMDGKFDRIGEPNGDVSVGVRLRYSLDEAGRRIPDRRPMVLLTIG